MTPADPISNLLEAAVAIHEMYKRLVEAGFSEGQALRLVGYMLAGWAQGGSDDEH
jgi:hypothetical protein